MLHQHSWWQCGQPFRARGATMPIRYEALTHPLLPVAVFHIIDPAVIPVHSDAQQVNREEPILSQNHKVSEEAPQGLDHTWSWENHL